MLLNFHICLSDFEIKKFNIYLIMCNDNMIITDNVSLTSILGHFHHKENNKMILKHGTCRHSIHLIANRFLFVLKYLSNSFWPIYFKNMLGRVIKIIVLLT